MSYRDQLIDAEELIEELEKKNKGLEATLERVKNIVIDECEAYPSSCEKCLDNSNFPYKDDCLTHRVQEALK